MNYVLNEIILIQKVKKSRDILQNVELVRHKVSIILILNVAKKMLKKRCVIHDEIMTKNIMFVIHL